MVIGSGLGAQFGIADEGSVGTIATPDHFVEIISEGLELSKNIVESASLRGGTNRFRRQSRRAYTTKSAGGSVSLEVPAKGFGLWLKHILGSSGTPTQISTTGMYTQIHTPGTLTGKSFTAQKGVPTTGGTAKPFTYNGCKVTEATFNCAVGEILTADISIDAWNETTATALASASVPSSAIWHFAQGVLKLGGTPTTTTGVTSISGGTTVAEVQGASVTVTNAMKTDRFYLGSAGIKAEQIENDFSNVGGSLTAEFVNQATIYDVMAADTALALQLTFTGAIGGSSGTNRFLFDILLPSINLDGETPKVGGPDVVGLTAPFTALDDTTNPVIQITYQSSDSAI